MEINPVLVEVERSGFVESRHRGAAIGLDTGGEPVVRAGAPEEPIFPRSANKPMQAVAMLRNGLDLDGVRWIRTLLRGFAEEGRTVLVSSHLMSEMELTADRLVIIGRGRLIADTTVRELISAGSATLEDAYLRLTDDAVEHRVGGGAR